MPDLFKRLALSIRSISLKMFWPQEDIINGKTTVSFVNGLRKLPTT